MGGQRVRVVERSRGPARVVASRPLREPPHPAAHVQVTRVLGRLGGRSKCTERIEAHDIGMVEVEVGMTQLDKEQVMTADCSLL